MSKRSRREERQSEPSGWFMSNWKVDPVGVVIIVLAALCVLGMIFS